MKTKATLLFAVSLLFVGALALTPASSAAGPEAVGKTAVKTNAEPAATPARAAKPQTPAPDALVRDLYKQHKAKHSPFFQTRSRALLDKYFAKTLADLIWKDVRTSKGEVGAIDGDPLYNAQDMEIKAFAIGKGEVSGDTASVAVTFTNFGEKKTITFSLKLVGAAWRIDNILYGDGDSLMKWLQDTYPPKSGPLGGIQFQGQFQVGDTTCMVVVVPADVAFQVTWAKGAGVEMFYQRSGLTFESAPTSGALDRFDFNDAVYTTGTFTRADGKTFPVKRLN